jgi:hypothetical protein
MRQLSHDPRELSILPLAGDAHRRMGRDKGNMSQLLSPRDWSSFRAAYAASAPFSHMVLDDLLEPSAFQDIRNVLLRDGGWRRKNWQVNQLFNKQPPLPGQNDLVEQIKSGLGPIASDLELVKHWAVACHENEGLHVHSDNAKVAVNLWLTPDEHNRAPGSGGLILYRLKREPTMMVHQFNAMPWSGEYFAAANPAVLSNVPYRANRAVIFDASIFHASDEIRFVEGSMNTIRIGLTMAFDVPEEYAARMRIYGSSQGEL